MTMQKIIVLLALGTMLIACQGSTEQADVAEPVKRDVNQGGVPDSILMPITEANNQIQRYHESVNLGNGDTTTKTAFMLDANVLRNYLNNDTSIAKLSVYLAEKITSDGSKEMNLIYIGAIDSSGIYVEKAYTKTPGDRQQYLLNHVMPCPECVDRMKIHQPPHGQ
jgi:hypothetical protein